MEKYSSVPLNIIPLKEYDLRVRGLYKREHDPKQSTEFTYTRFLVPHLAGFSGWALFADDDFLWLGDVSRLFALADDRFAVMCVKHDYTPATGVKLANSFQEPYPRKNWSSLMLLNCAHPANRALSLETVNSQTGAFLHRFAWIDDDSLIGEIDVSWNFLAGWNTPFSDGLPNAVHFTEGGPWFPDHRNVAYGNPWLKHMREYEKGLLKKRLLCPYELFSISGNPSLPEYENSSASCTC